VEGFSLHAGTHVHENDRPGLEHLCRYGIRPPLALTRLKKTLDDSYIYSLKYPLPNGAYELKLTGQEMMSRLALLIPRPRVHTVHYRGVFASHSSWRKFIVPSTEVGASHLECEEKTPKVSTAMVLPDSPIRLPFLDIFIPAIAPMPRDRYLDWASLLRRVYGEEVLVCPYCQATRRIIAFIEDHTVARKILEHLGLPATGPPIAPARPRPQMEMFLA
jgi:hypothetical protein